jgi:chaperonin GroEL
MQDIALLTGGTVVSEETGMKLEQVQPQHLGRCKKVEVGKSNTVILDGAGEKVALTERCDLIRHSIETTKSDYEREKLQERLAKLSGGVAIIRVGGSSEVEVSEKKDRVVDALNATRAAVEEGIVPGGGKALLYCSTLLDEVAEKEATNMDQKIGVQIIQRALRAPLFTIAKNAGAEGAVVCGELTKEGTDIAMGYDAQNGVYVDMFKAGIIDPTKVTRTGLVDAASVAGLLTTSEVMIVDKPDAGGPSGMPGGMGGMGGMPGMM